MSSIIQGYEYDIFISYRHNDNLSGWVTNFVGALQEELAATLKEPVSLYFDTNSPNGLLETYNVDKSLEGKLKCLIFIPIISQTYCDSKSYAWLNEFTVFNKMAKEDKFGRDIRITSGNVASRILPVKIHELEAEDKTLLEDELGGALRSIDFIYKLSGVNRPLSAREDHSQDNVNKTYYRDQINKVANAVKEIISALKSDLDVPSHEKVRHVEAIPELKKERTRRKVRRSVDISNNLVTSFFIITIFLAILIGYQLLSGKDNTNNTGEQIMEKAINNCDFFNKWNNYHGKISLRTVWENGTHTDEIIEVQTNDDFYQSNYIRADLNYIKGIKEGRCFLEINGNKNPDAEEIKKYNLDCDRTHYMKELHYCRIGLLMELKKSGMLLQKKIETVKFNGDNCLALTFQCDTSKIYNDYFNGLNYIVYIDPDDYSMKGLRWYGRINAFLVFSGVINVNGIKIPLCTTYFNSEDNSVKFIDIVTLAN